MLLTAPQADRFTVAAARGLAALGVRPGDRVGVRTPELDDPALAPGAQAATLAAVLACLRTGAIPVMIHPMLTAHERGYIAADAGLRVELDGARDLLALLDATGPAPDLADTLLGRPMHYTSGTTGRPKGVYARLTPAQADAYWADEIGHWGFTDTDVTLVHSPLVHSAPLRFAIGTLRAGGAVALVGRFDPDRIAAAMTGLRPTTAFVVPAQLQQLLALPRRPDPGSYRMLVHAGSPCPPPVKRRTHEWVGAHRVVEFYSSTEGHFTTCPGPQWEDRPGTVGRARAGRVVTTDADGTVWCRPPAFAAFEYWGAADKTAAAWRDGPDGRAFTVGDLGRLDADGYLTLDARREDLIITGGMNVYPAEVEASLAHCPGVVDVVVYGLADRRWGQRVCAAYTGTADPAAVAAWARAHLAAYKRPKQLRPVAELPRNSMGKLVRAGLAQL